MPSVNSFTITYNALNEENTFSEGDTLTGKVTLSLAKDTTVGSLFVKVKGDAQVRWTKKQGDHNHTYSASKRYFKLKKFLVPEESREVTIPRGIHVYDFRFNIPAGSMPSSYRGSHGKIVYLLEAKLSRSWRMDSTAEKELHFVSKSYPNIQSLLSHHVGSTKKEMGFFSKGRVSMDVIVDRRAFAPGQTIAIVAKINNASSSEMTPKFSLIRNVVFRAQGNTKCENHVVQKVVDNRIQPQTEKTVRCALKLPTGITKSVSNCDILSVEYVLKVYLDISFSFDPEVDVPVFIVPPDVISHHQAGGAMGPYPSGAAGGPSNSDFPRPATAMGPYAARPSWGPSNSAYPPPAMAMGPHPAGPTWQPINSALRSGAINRPPSPYRNTGAPTYSSPPMYPGQPANMSAGARTPAPPLASLYGDPFSAPSSTLHPPPPPMLHPPPSAPEMAPPAYNLSPSAPLYTELPSAPSMDLDFLSQSDEAPPSYSVLFPSSAPGNSDAK